MSWFTVDEDKLGDAAAAFASNETGKGTAVLAGALVTAFLAQPLGAAAAAVVGGTANGLIESVSKKIADGATQRFLAAGAKVDEERSRKALLKQCVREATEAAVAPLQTFMESRAVEQNNQFLILFICIQDVLLEVRQLSGHPKSGASALLGSRPLADQTGSRRCGWQIVQFQGDDHEAKLMDAQQWDELVAHYKKLEEQGGHEDVNAWVEHLHRRALVERNYLHEPVEALETLSTAFFIHPHRDDICVELGDLAAITDRLDQLIQKTKQCLGRCNQDADAAQYRLSLARWHELNKDPRLARDEVLIASRLAPRHPRVLRQRGEVHLADLHEAKAEECFRKALSNSIASHQTDAARSSELRHDYIREQMALHYGLARICEPYPPRRSEAVTHYSAALGMYSMGQSSGLGIPPQLMTERDSIRPRALHLTLENPHDAIEER